MSLSHSQYQAIMRIYNERQYQDKHDQDKRREEIYGRFPRVRALEEEIAAQAAAHARRLLDGDAQAGERLKEKTAELRGQIDGILRENGYPADYMQMRYVCPLCGDTGYVDGKKCRCFVREQMNLLYAQSNIADVLRRENFSTFSFDVYDGSTVIPELDMTVSDYMRRVHGWCLRYVEEFPERHGSLLFTGGTGVGKTFLTNCIARELIDRCYSVIYLSANDLVDVFSGSKFHSDSEEDMKETYRHLLECDLLIIDDLGTELNNSFVSSQLFYCINERMVRRAGTIISTNLSVPMLRDVYSDRVSSRIISGYEIIPLYGEDIRTKR